MFKELLGGYAVCFPKLHKEVVGGGSIYRGSLRLPDLGVIFYIADQFRVVADVCPATGNFDDPGFVVVLLNIFNILSCAFFLKALVGVENILQGDRCVLSLLMIKRSRHSGKPLLTLKRPIDTGNVFEEFKLN